MSNEKRFIIILDPYPFEGDYQQKIRQEVIKVIIEPNIENLKRLGFGFQPKLYANAYDDYNNALRKTGLYFVHYSRYREYFPIRDMYQKWVIFYSNGELSAKMQLKSDRHYWYSGKLYKDKELCFDPPHYMDFFKNWNTFEQFPPFSTLG
jgi:hypothetical protein